jgi:transcriptional regulator with XRE-family HTH domain
MALDCGFTHRLKTAQQEMFRLAKAKYGFTQEAIHHASGIDRSSVGQYARGETAMSGPAIMAVAAIDDFPAELLSLLFQGTQRVVCDEKQTLGLDYDQVSHACRDFIAAKDDAHHPQSECGRDIGPRENATLGCKVIELKGKVG